MKLTMEFDTDNRELQIKKVCEEKPTNEEIAELYITIFTDCLSILSRFIGRKIATIVNQEKQEEGIQAVKDIFNEELQDAYEDQKKKQLAEEANK